MAFSYSQNIQNRIALSIWGVQNSALTADQKAHLDGTAASFASNPTTGAVFDALTRITQIANWFEMAGSTSAPQAWEHWLVAETCLLLAPIYRPERMAMYTQEREVAIDAALDSFTLRDPIGTFSSSNDSQQLTVQGLRYFVLNHCSRRKESGVNTGIRRRIFVPIDEIDSHIQWVLNFIYNKEPWNFRKREVYVIIRAVTGITGATYTESTKTITLTGAFANMLSLTGRHARWMTTGGTGVLLGETQIASKTSSDAIVLSQSILPSGATADPTDVCGQLFTIELRGTLPSETFDAVASRKLYYQSDSSSSWLGCDTNRFAST